MLHRVHLDRAAHERERHALRDAGSLHEDAHRCTRGATNGLHYFVGGESVRWLAFDHHDAIAGRQSGLLSGRTRYGADDRHAAVAHVHLDADASVVTTRALVEAGESARIEKDRVRITQLPERAVDRVTVQCGIRQCVHKVAPDVLQHLIQQMRARREVARGPRGSALDEPAAGDERAGEHC